MSKQTHPWTHICRECKQPAIHRVAVPLPNDPILWFDHEHIDGTPVRSCDAFACDSCGASLMRHMFDDGICDPSHWVRRE